MLKRQNLEIQTVIFRSTLLFKINFGHKQTNEALENRSMNYFKPRKTAERYLDLFLSLAFNTIKTELKYMYSGNSIILGAQLE